jgi:HAD superfamily hydrolase (TIGR01509 family)
VTKAVIFDCFGVLTTDGWLKFREDYLLADSEADAVAVELNRQSDAGLISFRDFRNQLAQLANVDPAVVHDVMSSHARNDRLFDYIASDLKANYKIGLLSNAAGNYINDLFTPEQASLFDATLFSYELGIVKPNRAMYDTIAARLGVSTEECIFVDDRAGFVQGAIDAGMRAFTYTTFAVCRLKLQEMLD